MAALLYIETFKQSIASVTRQYNLVLANDVGKHADWACVQDETQAEPSPLALQIEIVKQTETDCSEGTRKAIYGDARNRT